MDKAANNRAHSNKDFFFHDLKLERGHMSFKPVIPVQILAGNNISA